MLGLEKVFGRTPDAATQTPDEVNVVSYVKSRVEEVRATAARVAQEGTWLTNTAYLLGFDQVYYDTQFKQFRPISNVKKPLALNRIHVNQILPTIQNRLAKLCKNPPRYDVRPESTSSEHKDAARLALQVLNMLWERLEMNRKRIELLMWVQQAGHAYLKVHWDPMKGNFITDPLTGEEMFEGDVSVDVVSPFEVFSDPLATNDDDAKWKVQAKVRRLSYFKENYDKGHLVKEEDAWLLSAQYEMQLNNMNGASPSSGGTNPLKNSAIELIYYEKRSRKHPKGRMIVCANGILLENKELPVGEIPLIKFDDITIAGKYYPEAIVTHLRPIQDAYNELLRKRQKWVQRLLNGKIIAPRDSGIMEESLRNDSAEVVLFDAKPNAPIPQEMGMPTIPAYAYEEEEKLKLQFDETAGISQPSKGQLPAAGLPAVGMQMLIEADDTRIGIETEGHEISYAKTGKLILLHVKEGYKTPRLLKVSGGALDYAVKEFKGEDIKSTDVIVIRGSTLPGSKTLKRQELLNYYAQGLLGDPMDPKVKQKVFAVSEFADLGELWQDQAVREGYVKRQIELIEQGNDPEIHEMDPHDMWLVHFERLRLSDKWETYAPEIQEMFEHHEEMHIQALVRLENPALAAEEKVKEEMKLVQSELAQNPELQAEFEQGLELVDEPGMTGIGEIRDGLEANNTEGAEMPGPEAML